MRIMGLDVGDRRIGVAVSDGLGITAQPVETVDRNEWRKSLRRIIDDYEVGSIVIGLPKMMNGTIGVQGGKVQDFADEIREAFGLPVEFQDERLTTVSAERTLLMADMSRKKRKSARDKLAAVIILQNYLDGKQR